MLSFAPAASTRVSTGLTARPGSFCLLCEKYPSSLPTVTSVSPPGVIGAASSSSEVVKTRQVAASPASMADLRIGTPLPAQRGVIQTECRNHHAATVLTMQYLAFSTCALRG